jgi:hypothetical protein
MAVDERRLPTGSRVAMKSSTMACRTASLRSSTFIGLLVRRHRL